jgi:hypothetical protein
MHAYVYPILPLVGLRAGKSEGRGMVDIRYIIYLQRPQKFKWPYLTIGLSKGEVDKRANAQCLHVMDQPSEAGRGNHVRFCVYETC